jgi:hypothetical protein
MWCSEVNPAYFSWSAKAGLRCMLGYTCQETSTACPPRISRAGGAIAWVNWLSRSLDDAAGMSA